MIISLEDVKHQKRLKARYEVRRYLIKVMIEYEDKYTLDELIQDFYGILKAMNKREKC